MTSTDNTSKPLETVDNLLAAVYLAGTENGLGRSITDHKEIVHRREAFIKANPVCKEAQSEIYQLMLSLVGDMEYRETLDMGLSSWTSEDYKAFGRNELRSELCKKLSEHFNVEGEV